VFDCFGGCAISVDVLLGGAMLDHLLGRLGVLSFTEQGERLGVHRTL